MPQPLALLRAQHNDYQTLLSATEALLGSPLVESDVAAYTALREQLLTATSSREPALSNALQHPAGATLAKAIAEYRSLLESLVSAEARLLAEAETCRDSLGNEVRALGEGYRALSGYRVQQRSGDARAISQRI